MSASPTELIRASRVGIFIRLGTYAVDGMVSMPLHVHCGPAPDDLLPLFKLITHSLALNQTMF